MPENPRVSSPLELIPSIRGGVSALASAHAPFLYFEDAIAFNHLNGIIRLTLTASRDVPEPGSQGAGTDLVIVAHLRMNVPAALSLKAALEGALLLAQPAQSETRN
jgi:hypothetical protein